MRGDAITRFWAKVEKTETCWLWRGWKSGKGYGRFAPVKTAPTPAHRFSWTLVHGQIPDGLTIDHLCKVRACVNPAHLRLLSHIENSRQGGCGGVQSHCKRGHEYGPSDYNSTGTKHLCKQCRKVRGN